MCLHYPKLMYSYYDLHKMTKRATTNMICTYKLALSLYKTFNERLPYSEWLQLNFNQVSTSRQIMFLTHKQNNLKIGLNCLSNRYHHLNGKIPLKWLNNSFDSSKIECKHLFLNFWKILKDLHCRVLYYMKHVNLKNIS